MCEEGSGQKQPWNILEKHPENHTHGRTGCISVPAWAILSFSSTSWICMDLENVAYDREELNEYHIGRRKVGGYRWAHCWVWVLQMEILTVYQKMLHSLKPIFHDPCCPCFLVLHDILLQQPSASHVVQHQHKALHPVCFSCRLMFFATVLVTIRRCKYSGHTVSYPAWWHQALPVDLLPSTFPGSAFCDFRHLPFLVLLSVTCTLCPLPFASGLQSCQSFHLHIVFTVLTSRWWRSCKYELSLGLCLSTVELLGLLALFAPAFRFIVQFQPSSPSSSATLPILANPRYYMMPTCYISTWSFGSSSFGCSWKWKLLEYVAD